MEQMTCTVCLEPKDLDYFSFRFKSRGIRKKRCRDCDKRYHDDYYLQNRTKEIARCRVNNVKTRERNRERLYRYFLSHSCVDCGNSDPLVLEFDHVRGEKKYNVSNMIARAFSWNTILEEISKCDVRCANCHRIKTAKESGWFKSLAGVA